MDRSSRVVIVGAGPAGLSTAYWLKQRGYTDVLVLEKLQRVGGLCKSITVHGDSFDLGANFITKAYTNVQAFAKTYRAKMHSEDPFAVMVAPTDTSQPVAYDSLFHYVRVHDDGTTTSAFVFGLAVMKFVWIRWRLRHLLDAPTFEGVGAHPELCTDFESWLEAQAFWGKDLSYYLGRLFQVPITMMGYGLLTDTAAPYCLKFMTLKTFIPMCVKAIPVVGKVLTPWPKRLDTGFQRLWERMAWDLDVRTGVHIASIERPETGDIVISFTQLDQDLGVVRTEQDTLQCDVLILACPLRASRGFLAWSDAEKALFECIHSYDYCMTSHEIADFGGGLAAATGGATSPLLCVFPETAATRGRPWAVAQAKKGNDFVQFYSRHDRQPGESFDEVRAEVVGAARALVDQMALANPTPPQGAEGDDGWHTFDRWEYFQHVKVPEFAAGWYDDLARLQGTDRTYYVGGATNFELIEPITAFSKDLVERHFPGDPIPSPVRWKRWLAAGAAGALILLAILLPPDELYIETPISDRTPAAEQACEAFWDAYHAQAYDRVDPVITDLKRALDADPEDAIVASLLGSAHLWRFSERRRVDGKAADYQHDLVRAMRYSKQTLELELRDGDNTSVPSTFAPAMHGVAKWQLGRLQADQGTLDSAAYELISSAIAVPQFDGFVLGWVTGALQRPDDPYADFATIGMDEMMDACAGFPVPEDQVFSWPVMVYLSVKAWLQPELRLCYNNPLAPHNLEGYFLAAGDAFVMAGRFDVARVNYENAQRMPRYDGWPFKDELEARLQADLPQLRQTFIDQVNLVDIPAGPTASSMRTGHGCSYCHAESD